MLTVYRAEVFNRSDFSPRGQAIIENPEITFDYLTLETTKIVCKSLSCAYGDWIRIVNQNGEIVYSGIVENVLSNSKMTEITVAPLQNLLNVNTIMQYNRNGEGFTTAESFLLFMFDYIYQYGSFSDPALEVPFSYQARTSTPCPKMPTTTEQVNNQWAMAQYILKQTGVVMNMGIDVQNRKISIVNEAVTNPVVVELDKDYVLDYEVSDGSSEGYDSVAVYYGENEGTLLYHNYCLHTDGIIDDELSVDRYLPVKYTETTSQEGNDEEGVPYSYSKAVELLQNGKWVNEIKVTVANNNRVISANLPIGSQAIIMDGDKAYETILTGYVKKELTTSFIFGTIRSELTKQLAIQKIANGREPVSEGEGGGGTYSLDLMPNEETQIGTYNSKAMFAQVIAWSNGAIPATTLVKIGSLNCEVDEVISVDFNATPSNRVYFWAGSVRDGGVYHQGVRITKSNGDVYYHYNDAWSNGTMIKAFIMYTKV